MYGRLVSRLGVEIVMAVFVGALPAGSGGAPERRASAPSLVSGETTGAPEAAPPPND
ncbi:MAG: hypothetical protein WDO69_26780 [Pseudomonadota bacterium]